ncbi:leucine-rich repeat extensin-like protein 1 [Mangifera indica]|uniref:leucine-rich repeat extensin-like protein 1 n=1 Tax=Mangifera indica TaxID=29780 RepID=UPI001CFB89B3|nr:leucine-rich repeat extensin-like protein 1 [Mangifera indica]
MAIFLFILLCFLPLTMQEEPCPYPCYPPPTGSGSATPTTPSTLPPPATSYSPPQGYNYPTPSGNLPNYPSPPFGNNYGNPPPPDPILPYFPFYYKNPPHKTDEGSSAASRLGRRSSSSARLVLFSFSFFLLPLV